MNTNTKTVLFGTKQEAVLSPKEGYEVETVTVINTANNQVIPSELEKISDNPAQWICSFIQPAASVAIRPVVKPIVYSVTIEICDNCNIVLLEKDSSVEVEIKRAASNDDNNLKPEEGDKKETPTGFNNPQHSVNEGAKSALDVEDSDSTDTKLVDEKVTDTKVITENEEVKQASNSFENDINNGFEKEARREEVDSTDVAKREAEEPAQLGDNDMPYEATGFEEELEDFEPIIISQKEYDDKNALCWQYREAYDSGKISKEEFDEVYRKHMRFMNDISAGKIIVQ